MNDDIKSKYILCGLLQYTEVGYTHGLIYEHVVVINNSI